VEDEEVIFRPGWKGCNGKKTRVADPDPDSIGSVDPDPDLESDPDPGGQKLPTKVKFFLKFHVFKCWMVSFES
jgi:hypothetical protein